MGPEWVVVDKLVHELGSLRAVVQEVEARPGMAGDEVVVELRSLLNRAADTVHLVVGGDEAMVSRAWQCIGEAQELGQRALQAVGQARAMQRDARSIADQTRAIAVAGRITREQADAALAHAEERVAALKQKRKARETRSDSRPRG